ncbi:uncharacterized protein VTP21DRAFT_8390 [Calcarisporiella thermophila]|uniref:uncharacterized protein n=1 Tax=Calcarisporiella thermophila TaxID=911321 RepID=UPI00374264C8
MSLLGPRLASRAIQRSQLSLRISRPSCPLYLLNPINQVRFAGHNKWSKVKHIKAKKDVKRNVLFTKIALEIISSIKSGGSDFTLNGRLAAALTRAKTANMPKDSIENVIQRATGQNKDNTESVLYEGLGPCNVALIIEAVTDNRNRTVKEVKEVLNKVGGSLTSVSWMFEKKGKICFTRGLSSHSMEQMIDNAIEEGAEDIDYGAEDEVEIFCDISKLSAISSQLTSKFGYEVNTCEFAYIPNTVANISADEEEERVRSCLEQLLDLESVIRVHTNAPS